MYVPLPKLILMVPQNKSQDTILKTIFGKVDFSDRFICQPHLLGCSIIPRPVARVAPPSLEPRPSLGSVRLIQLGSDQNLSSGSLGSRSKVPTLSPSFSSFPTLPPWGVALAHLWWPRDMSLLGVSWASSRAPARGLKWFCLLAPEQGLALKHPVPPGC